jgi:N-acetylglutamate synthase-like GNAT family acetyltransferase
MTADYQRECVNMIFAALNEAAERGELLIVEGGLCRFHVRRDGTLVIREVIVLPGARRRGIGSKLVHRACITHRGLVIAKCPVKYESNRFWQEIGFQLVGEGKGINEWRLDLT